MLTNDNDESRRLVETCYKRHKTTLNPIIDWTDRDVWDFIHGEDIPYCCLYDEGMHRLGCIGCPMAGTKQREKEFIRWPIYKENYIAAFDRMLLERKHRGKYDATWRLATAIDVYNWWMQYDVMPGQFNLFEDYEEET